MWEFCITFFLFIKKFCISVFKLITDDMFVYTFYVTFVGYYSILLGYEFYTEFNILQIIK